VLVKDKPFAKTISPWRIYKHPPTTAGLLAALSSGSSAMCNVARCPLCRLQRCATQRATLGVVEPQGPRDNGYTGCKTMLLDAVAASDAPALRAS